jgi:hypothetical protein
VPVKVCAEPFVPVRLAILLGFARMSNTMGVSNHGIYNKREYALKGTERAE